MIAHAVQTNASTLPWSSTARPSLRDAAQTPIKRASRPRRSNAESEAWSRYRMLKGRHRCSVDRSVSDVCGRGLHRCLMNQWVRSCRRKAYCAAGVIEALRRKGELYTSCSTISFTVKHMTTIMKTFWLSLYDDLSCLLWGQKNYE